jgi:hypothetical protein
MWWVISVFFHNLLLLLSSTAFACDNEMEQQTQIMQQQLFSQQRQAQEQRQVDYTANIMLRNKYDKNGLTLAGLTLS